MARETTSTWFVERKCGRQRMRFPTLLTDQGDKALDCHLDGSSGSCIRLEVNITPIKHSGSILRVAVVCKNRESQTTAYGRVQYSISTAGYLHSGIFPPPHTAFIPSSIGVTTFRMAPLQSATASSRQLYSGASSPGWAIDVF